MKKFLVILFRIIGSVFLSMALVREHLDGLVFENDNIYFASIRIVIVFAFIVYILNKDLL